MIRNPVLGDEMGRQAKLWWRGDRKSWYSTIDGKQVNLGSDRKKAEKEFHALKAGSVRVDRFRLTVIGACDLYLDWAERHVKPKTFNSYRHYLQSWINHVGTMRITEIKKLHVTGWLAKNKPRTAKRINPLAGNTYQGRLGWESSTQRLAISVVKIWSSWLKSEGYLEVNPLLDYRRPKMMVRKPAASGALEKVLETTKCPRFHNFLTILLDIGCRPGELRTLEAQSIDWDNAEALVSGQTGPRTISLTQRALDILREAAKEFPAGPVLRNTRGKPWKEQAVECAFRRASKRAGVKVTSYHPRHAFWAKANRAGVDSVVVARQMGNTDISMIIKHYAHVDHAATRNAVEKASKEST
jgi:integrase